MKHTESAESMLKWQLMHIRTHSSCIQSSTVLSVIPTSCKASKCIHNYWYTQKKHKQQRISTVLSITPVLHLPIIRPINP